jgi:NADH dehydrogenase
VVIVGAGYTGLEVALALRDGFGPDRPAGQGTTPLRITVVEAGADILPMARERERRRVYEYLGARGIELKLGTTLDGAVQSADGPGVRLSDGTEIPRALVCWSAGMRAVGIGLQEQLPHTGDGRIHTNEYLQAPGHPEVMIAGDAAALQRDGELVRRAVNFAYYSGRRAGRNLAAYLSNQASGSMKPFQPVDLGWIIPLGDASIGRLLGTIPVGGRFASRLHYIMSGFRHFGGGRAGEFYRTAVHLRRRPDPVYAAAATRSRPAAERSSPARVGDEA